MAAKVARFLGSLLHRLGAVESDAFVEVQRRDLVADKVGATGRKTREKIEEAKGGVIFVDEAYTLAVPDSDKDFGREAIDELMCVSRLDRSRHLCVVTIARASADRCYFRRGRIDTVLHRKDMLVGDPVVIIAGYPDEMARFLASNAGLARRFEHTLTFPDYSVAELGRIFCVKATEASFGLAPELRGEDGGALIGELLERHTTSAWRTSAAAGNARVAERLFHLAYEALARRNSRAHSFVLEDVQAACRALGELNREWAERGGGAGGSS